MPIPLPTRRFTADEYERMGEVGILGPEDRVELLDGEIVRKMTIDSPHAASVTRLTRAFFRGVGDTALVRTQQPIRLSDLSVPEPDVALVKSRPDDYAKGHPRPDDTLLIIEVSDSSLRIDRDKKMPLYALAGVCEYWILDMNARGVEVYRRPSSDGYESGTRYGEGDVLIAEATPGLEIQVSSILP